MSATVAAARRRLRRFSLSKVYSYSVRQSADGLVTRVTRRAGATRGHR